MIFLILIKNINIFTPESIGVLDILISGEKIIHIDKNINIPSTFPEYTVINGEGLYALPGIIDLHIHISGAGGEDGFSSRTEELKYPSIVESGITTAIGLLGTDGSTRSMENLLAKAYSLEERGLTTYLWTGSYQIPLVPLTEDIKKDIIFIPKIIGVGELAVSDHRGSHPSTYDLIKICSMTRNAGLISGKCGITHFHLGDGKEKMSPIFNIVNNSEIPLYNILPTHINRNTPLFFESIDYCKKGGYVDITTGIRPDGDDVVDPPIAFKQLLESGCNVDNITMSSDSGGSMPIFEPDGTLKSITTSPPTTNLDVFRDLVRDGMDISTAITPLTSSPAKLLKFKNKGYISVGFDADIMILDNSLNLKSLIARGNILYDDYKLS
ncbi:MAG: beta-aspartyl-peptidase [Clostridium sp.]|uniref:beta-aspartyl-peptidase n=1 Tax=Clostridium sp. TaxID=1506 RepID=UPI002FCC5DC7